MFYKNKTIRHFYRAAFWFWFTGSFLLLFGLFLLIYGCFATNRVLNDIHPFEEFLKRDGNHAVHAATFEITAEPKKVGSYKRVDYYLVTDGHRYILSELTQKQYRRIASEVKSKGSYQLKGMTLYVTDKKVRKEIADNVSRITGHTVAPGTLDSFVGDVQLMYCPHTFVSVYRYGFTVNLVFGVMMGFTGFLMGIVNGKKVLSSRKVESVSGITAQEIDREANGQSLWFGEDLFLGEHLVVSLREQGPIAFRYEEISRVYGSMKKKDVGDSSSVRARYLIRVVDRNEKEYLLSEAKVFTYSEGIEIRLGESLMKELNRRAPHILLGPEDMRSMTFRYPFFVYEEEDGIHAASGVRAYELGKDWFDDLASNFQQENLGMFFSDPESILGMEMTFKEDGFVEIRVDYPAPKEEVIRESMDEFLKGQLMDGWGEGVFDPDADLQIVFVNAPDASPEEDE